MKIKKHSKNVQLRLNIKKSKLMTTGVAASRRIDNEDINVVDSLLGSDISSKETSREEKCHIPESRQLGGLGKDIQMP